jgi:hypothetical protein
MLELFFNSSGIFHMEFIPEGAVVNEHCYKEILCHLGTSLHLNLFNVIVIRPHQNPVEVAACVWPICGVQRALTSIIIEKYGNRKYLITIKNTGFL